jgi:hypothetical protein
MTSPSNQRTRQVVLPTFQFRLTARFVGLSMAALLCQFLFMGILLTRIVRGYPGTDALVAEVPAIVFKTVLFMAVLQLPIVVAGLMLTFRVAGPVYRFDTYLRALARGEHGGPCSIREKDEFGFLSETINEVAERMDALRAQVGEVPLEPESVEPGDDPVELEDESALRRAG